MTSGVPQIATSSTTGSSGCRRINGQSRTNPGSAWNRSAIWSLTSLPEELEKYRTALMPLVIKKTGKETGILFAASASWARSWTSSAAGPSSWPAGLTSSSQGKHGPEYQACRDQPPDPGARKNGPGRPCDPGSRDQRRILRLKGLVQELGPRCRAGRTEPSGEAESAAEEPPGSPLPEPN